MKLLNIGCGGCRPQSPDWWNLDNLRTQLKEGTPERINLDAEPRYVESDLLSEGIPFASGIFDGVAAIHVIEHFSCHDAVMVLMECRRVLKENGLLVVSVPDARYFLNVYERDTKENAQELFGEPIHDKEFDRFFDYALFRHDHKQILCEESLRCLLIRAGFEKGRSLLDRDEAVWNEIQKIMTRRKFSVEMSAIK